MPKGVYKRKTLVHGVGINDVEDFIGYGNTPYVTWTGILFRVGSHKNYLDCSICDDWKYFSKFRAWMEAKNYTGLCLDKDIIMQGNKVYTPEFCAFVPQNINKVLCLKARKRDLPIGVSDNKHPKGSVRFDYSVSMNDGKGNPKHLGYFATPEEAHKAWQWQKSIQIEQAVTEYARQQCFLTEVADGLMQRVWKLRAQCANNQQTTFI